MSILVTICARGGSKGIPNKNIKLLGGKSLIGYSIEIGLEFAEKHEGFLALSTDANYIKSAASEFGLKTTYVRPERLANDTVGKIAAIEDLLLFEENRQGKSFDYILDLDVTSPLRNYTDLYDAYEILKEKEKALNIFSVSPAGRNPYFNMVEQEGDYVKLVKQLDNPLFTRQSSPKVYDLNASFYIYRRSFFKNKCKSALTDNSLIYIVPHICFDIDEKIDFDIMEYLINDNKLGFTL